MSAESHVAGPVQGLVSITLTRKSRSARLFCLDSSRLLQTIAARRLAKLLHSEDTCALPIYMSESVRAASRGQELHAKPLDKFVIEFPDMIKYCHDVT